jgi:hypothetical protein
MLKLAIDFLRDYSVDMQAERVLSLEKGPQWRHIG